MLIVALGGGIGASLRYLVSCIPFPNKSGFPYATLSVNVIGCFCLGILTGWLMKQQGTTPVTMQLFIGIGILGGFTTFSTFSIDSIKLLQSGNTTTFILYVLSSNLLGILLGYLGLKIAGNI